MQSPANASRFKAIGINLYVGLWRGPTAQQLDTLAAAGMPVICSQTDFALAHKANPIIVGWMHEDEPDNAQSLGNGCGYGPPITPEVIQKNYARMRAADPARPVLLNLGQGVAWDDYIGRGVRGNHPEDYPLYLKGCDIACFDIYPVVHGHPAVRGKLEYVAHGVDRLQQWKPPGTAAWNCIECTHISNPSAKAGPDQIRAEVWMSIIRGSRGLIYFVHQFRPAFQEAALLEDPENAAAVARINAEVQSLAPAFSNEAPSKGLTLDPGTNEVATLFRQFKGSNYLFTASLSASDLQLSVGGEPLGANPRVEVLHEERTIQPVSSRMADRFAPYGVHIYRWPALPAGPH